MDASTAAAERLARSAARLIRLLKAADPAPRLSGAEASALAVVIHADGVSPSALAEIEDVSRPTAARTLASLRAKGLIRREQKEGDARAASLRATAAGRRLFDEGGRRRAAPLAALIESLPAKDQAAAASAAQFLEALTEALVVARAPIAASSPDRRGSPPQK